MDTVLMRVNVLGYHGQPVSSFCAYDPKSHVLVFNRVAPYDTNPPVKKDGSSNRDAFLLLTNQQTDAVWDGLLTDDDMRAAINAFFSMRDSGSLVFSEGMNAHDPAHRIERDGIDENGVKYRLAPDVSNGMVSAMYAALYAMRQRDVAMAGDMFSALIEIDV